MPLSHAISLAPILGLFGLLLLVPSSHGEEVLATAKFDSDGIATWQVVRDDRNRDAEFNFTLDPENPAVGVMNYTFQLGDDGSPIEGAREIKNLQFLKEVNLTAGSEAFLRANLRCSKEGRQVRFVILDATGQMFVTEPQRVPTVAADLLFSLNKFSSKSGGAGGEQIAWPVRSIAFQSVWWGGPATEPPERLWIEKIELVKGNSTLNTTKPQ